MEDTAEHFYALSAGTRLDEYEIVSIIGQGSFGITYLAEDVNLGLRFAVKEYLPGDWAVRDSTKTVRPKSSTSRKSFEWGMDAFLKEARILASISHPNIVKVRRFFRANGTAYIVMDFIAGRGFGDILASDYAFGGFPNASLNAMLLSLLDGLSAVHRAGIVHRDIKPGNILIEANGNPILIDFGAARNYQRTLAGGMTVIMTPGYAPIEQYAEDGDQGPFTDIYSLGAVAYRAITGQAPMEPYKRLSGGAFIPAASAGAGRYAAPLLAAIDWAISIQPKDRPQSAADLAATLRADKDEPTKILPTGSARSADPKSVPSESGRDAALSQHGSHLSIAPRKLVPITVVGIVIAVAVAGFAYYRSTVSTPVIEVEREQADLKAAELANQDAERKAAEAAQREADRKIAEAAQQEADRRAAEAAKQQADRNAAQAAQREADRQAAEAAQQEADRKAAAAAQQAADRQAAEAAKQEADRKAAEAAKQDAMRRAAEAAKQEAARKAAETARLEADRQAAEAAKQEAARKAAALDGRWYADLPRNFCGGARIQAMVMGNIIFGTVGLPAGSRAFRASIEADRTFSSIGQFDRIRGKFADNSADLTVINSCSSWNGTARREPFAGDIAAKEEITAAFAGKIAHFANGEATYSPDGAYSFVDRSGPVSGRYVISDGAICVTFSSGVIRCDAILKDGASFVLVSNQGYRFSVTFK